MKKINPETSKISIEDVQRANDIAAGHDAISSGGSLDPTAQSKADAEQPAKAKSRRRAAVPTQTERRSVVMSPQLANDIDALAVLKGITTSEAIRLAIEQDVEANRERIEKLKEFMIRRCPASNQTAYLLPPCYMATMR